MTEQPPPSRNGHPPVWPLVIADMQARDELGRRRYGTPLQPWNGREALEDAYQEALDLAVYLKQALVERRHLATALHMIAGATDRDAAELRRMAWIALEEAAQGTTPCPPK